MVQRVPDSGVGSLVTFQSLLPGVLETGGRTIQAALDIQKAASVSQLQTPMSTRFYKKFVGLIYQRHKYKRPVSKRGKRRVIHAARLI
jgi:hypothetical protein